MVQDPLEAAYLLQTQVGYCHKAGVYDQKQSPSPVSPQASAAAGRLNGRRGYQAMAQPSQSDDRTYLCVADVLVTEQSKNSPSRTYKMRSVAHVLLKKLNIEEATPTIREKFVASITGAF